MLQLILQDVDVNNSSFSHCDHCGKVGKIGETLKFCGGCRAAKYCSTACQRTAWSSHKTACRLQAEARKKVNATSMKGSPASVAEFMGDPSDLCGRQLGRHINALTTKAHSVMAKGDTEGALRLCDEAMAKADFEGGWIYPDTMAAKGLVLCHAGRLDEGIDLLEESLAREHVLLQKPLPLLAAALKGKSRLGLSDTRCGGELDTSTEYNLAKALGIRGRDGDMKRVVNLLEVATRRKPQSTANANMLGNAYRRIARVDDAIGQYLHCLAFDPSCLDAHINLIACYQIQGNLAASAKHAREAVRIDPEVKMSADGVGPPIAALVKRALRGWGCELGAGTPRTLPRRRGVGAILGHRCSSARVSLFFFAFRLSPPPGACPFFLEN